MLGVDGTVEIVLDVVTTVVEVSPVVTVSVVTTLVCDVVPSVVDISVVVVSVVFAEVVGPSEIRKGTAKYFTNQLMFARLNSKIY